MAKREFIARGLTGLLKARGFSGAATVGSLTSCANGSTYIIRNENPTTVGHSFRRTGVALRQGIRQHRGVTFNSGTSKG